MKRIIALALLLASPAIADYRIRVTDNTGNVATSIIAASNRIENIDALAAKLNGGTNNAERIAAFLESMVREAGANTRREAIAERKRKESAAEQDAVKE